MKATAYGYDITEIDIEESLEEFPGMAQDLDLESPYHDEAMRAAAYLAGTHADSIELHDYDPGLFALYRSLYRMERQAEEQTPNPLIEEAMKRFGHDYSAPDTIRLCGHFLLLTAD